MTSGRLAGFGQAAEALVAQAEAAARLAESAMATCPEIGEFVAGRAGRTGRDYSAAAAAGHGLRRFFTEPGYSLDGAEIEHPSAHAGSAAHGDPAARVRFYARHGVRPLELPYFQPALRPELTRVYGLMLCVVALAERCRGVEPETVDGPRLHGWLVEYLTGSEGALGTDSMTRALLRGTRRAGGVRLLSFDEIDAVPYTVARIAEDPPASHR